LPSCLFGETRTRSVRRKALVLVLVLGAALAFTAAAFAGNGGFAPVTPHSPPAHSINESYKLIALLTGFIFVLVEGALVWFVVRSRRRNRPRTQEGPQIHGATKLSSSGRRCPSSSLRSSSGSCSTSCRGSATCRPRRRRADRSSSVSTGTSSTGSSRIRTARSRSTSCTCP